MIDTGRKLNVYKTFRRRPGRLLNALCTFNLRPVSAAFLPANYCHIIMMWITRLDRKSLSDVWTPSWVNIWTLSWGWGHRNMRRRFLFFYWQCSTFVYCFNLIRIWTGWFFSFRHSPSIRLFMFLLYLLTCFWIFSI